MTEKDNKPDFSEFQEWASETVRFRDSENIKIVKSAAEINSVLEDICAFANAGKGTVYFGVDADGVVVGQTIREETIRNIMTEIFLKISPPLFPRVVIKEFEGKKVLGIDIIMAPDKPYFYDGKYFKRMGTSNMSLLPHEIKIFMNSAKAPSYFDMKPVPDYPGGVNQERFDWYLTQSEFEHNLPADERSDDWEAMKKLGLFTDNRMNTAAVLCFGIDVATVLPQAKIICQLIDGTDDSGTVVESAFFSGDLFHQIEQMENFVSHKCERHIMDSYGSFMEPDQLEMLTMLINEAVVTAVVHRDYSLSDPIALLIFDDHIELIIPGNLSRWLANHITPVKHVVIPANPLLARIFYLAGLIEFWLPALDRFDEYMEAYGLPIPEYVDTQEYFGIILRWRRQESRPQETEEETPIPVYVHQPKTDDEADDIPETPYTQEVLAYCVVRRSRQEIQQHLHLKDRKHFRNTVLQPLLKQGLITMTIPGRPNSPKQKYITTAKGKKLLNG